MKLIRTDGDDYLFRLGKRETRLLTETLRQYPLIPGGYHRYSRSGVTADDPANQALLEESLAAHRAEHHRRVAALLDDSTRLIPDSTGYRLAVTRDDLEWLLQVLNEVRVGSWLEAGCPDPDNGKLPEITAENAPFFILMDVAAHFESVILDTL